MVRCVIYTQFNWDYQENDNWYLQITQDMFNIWSEFHKFPFEELILVFVLTYKNDVFTVNRRSHNINW